MASTTTNQTSQYQMSFSIFITLFLQEASKTSVNAFLGSMRQVDIRVISWKKRILVPLHVILIMFWFLYFWCKEAILLHCKYEFFIILVFSCVELPAVLNLSFLLLLVGYITSRSCSTSLRWNLSDYWYLKRQLEYSWQWHTTKIQNSYSFTLTVWVATLP